LSSKDTGDKEVVNSLILLVTERALLRMRQPTTRKAICRPTPIVGHQPKEKTAFGRAQVFQILSYGPN